MFRLSCLADPPVSARGRPRDADNPEKRRDQYRFATLVHLGWLSRKEAADAARVTPWTIWKWCRDLRASDEPEAEGLRRLRDR